MIITLTGATFTKYIGTLDSYTIFATVGSGCEPNGYTEVVDKESAYTKTFTLADGYDVGSTGVSVTMGGVSQDVTVVDGQTITITIPSVTGTVYIKIPTVNTSTGEEDSGTVVDPDSGGSETPSNKYTVTVSATPSTASIKIREGSLSTGTVLGEGVGSVSIQVDPGTQVGIGVSASGYYTQSQQLSVTDDTTLTFTLTEMNRPEGENIVTQGTLYEGYALSSGNYSRTENTDYYVYDQIPVEGGATYTVSNGLRAWWLTSSKTKINTINFKTTNYVATAPSNAAYVSITFPISVDPSEAFVIKTS